MFADEFYGTRLDVGKWRSGYPWGCTNETTGERLYYLPAALTIRDGLLVIEADRAGGGRLPSVGHDRLGPQLRPALR
jgi:hypothetical protein